MSNANFAWGTLLQRGDGETPEVFTTIAEVNDISGPGFALDTIEVTNHDSPEGWEEHIGGILRSGEITYDINYDKESTAHLGLISDMTGRIKRNFKITFPDDTEIILTALVTGFEFGAPVEDKLSASVTLKGTGKPTGLESTLSAGLSTLTGEDSAEGALVFFPTFDIDTLQYVVSVATGITSVVLVPTGAGHTITVNGNTVASGSESGTILLGAAGTITNIEIIAKETGYVPKVYTIAVARAAS